MSQAQPDLASQIGRLAARLARVEQRLATLETSPRSHAPAYDEQSEISTRLAGGEAAETEGRPSVWRESVPLAGRTLLVIAGAFLLRVITESGWLHQGAGTAVGIAYAILWLLLAEWAARQGKRNSATFHGLAALIIAYPLLWEATVKFEFLSPVLSAVALLGVTLTGLSVASLRSLRRLAWLVTIGTASTALALAVATRMPVLFVGLLVPLGLATLWLGYVHGWRGPGAFAAVVVDGAVLLLTFVVLSGDAAQVEQVIRSASLVYLQLALVLVYCGSFGARALIQSREVDAAEVLQGAAALIVGLGGAVAVSRVTGYGGGALGVVSLLLAIGCYGASFVFIDRRTGGRRNFIFFTSLALVFTLVAFGVLLRGDLLALALAASALIAAWLGAVRSRATLSLHGAVYALAAAVASGLPMLVVNALVGPDVPRVGSITIPQLASLAVAAACCWFSVAQHGRTLGRFSQVPKLLVIVVLTLSIDAVAVILIASALADAAGGTDLGMLAVVRTAVLAISVLSLALLGRSDRLVEAAWLVYPLLVVGGAKILLEDLPTGRPSTLVLSLVFYGGALALAPRLSRKAKTASAPGSEPT